MATGYLLVADSGRRDRGALLMEGLGVAVDLLPPILLPLRRGPPLGPTSADPPSGLAPKETCGP